MCALLKYNYDHGKRYGVVVVAEGCHLPEVGQVVGSAQVDSFGHARLSGIGEALAELIEKKTGFETRSVNLGHTQRGGVPTAFDRLLGQRYGQSDWRELRKRVGLVSSSLRQMMADSEPAIESVASGKYAMTACFSNDENRQKPATRVQRQSQ